MRNSCVCKLVMSAVFAAAVLGAAACGGGGPPPPDRGLGPPAMPHIAGISVPAVVEAGKAQTVRVSFYAYGHWELFSEEVKIDEEARTVNITILIREESSYIALPYVSSTSYYGDTDMRAFTINFPSLGVWVVRCNDLSKGVIVRGEWSGEEKPAEIREVQVPRRCLANETLPVRYKLAHSGGEWFYRRCRQEIDEDAKTVTLTPYDGLAESALSDDSWLEDVEVGLVFPTVGRWEVYPCPQQFSIRYVEEKALPTGYSLDDYIWRTAYPLAPSSILFPEEVRVNVEADCTVTVSPSSAEAVLSGMDLWYDPPNRALYGNTWLSYPFDYEEPLPPLADFHEQLTLTFTEPGQWMVVFNPDYGDSFIRVVNVLPAEE